MAWLSGYSKRKKITVQTAYLDAAQTDFPLYVPIKADTDIGAACLSTGYDVRFTASDGTTELPFERVSFAVAAGAATGIFWVKTALATSPATDIYCYYGNAAAADVSAPATTFSAYTRVWHLSEAYGTGAGNYKDALGVGHLTLTDADGDSAQDVGIVGKGIHLNRDADYLVDSTDHNDYDPGGALTIEGWVYLDELGYAHGSIIRHLDSGGNTRWRLRIWSPGGAVSDCSAGIISASGTTNTPTFAPMALSTWYYVVGTYDKTLGSNRLKLYIQGILSQQANAYAEDITTGNWGIRVGTDL